MGFHRGPNIITDGLVLYLDAGNPKSYLSGSTSWYDLSGNENVSTLINLPNFNSDNNGTIVFDGINEYINVDASVSTNIIGSITVSMFCKSNDISTIGWNAVWAGVSKYSQFLLGANQNNGKMGFLIFSGGQWYPLGYGGSVWGQTTINPRDWHLYTGVYNKNTGILYLYIDGIEEVSFDIGIRTLSDDPNFFTIARRDSLTGYLNCSISQVSIYNKALSAQEVLQNYNSIKSRFNL
jgi:hypothetical protein